jgi:hypothetical protein
VFLLCKGRVEVSLCIKIYYFGRKDASLVRSEYISIIAPLHGPAGKDIKEDPVGKRILT